MDSNPRSPVNADGGGGRRLADPPPRDRWFADSPLEGDGFELVWGFFCQVVGFWFAESSLFGAGRPFFEAQASDGANVCVIIRGELAIGRGSRTAHLYSVGPVG